MISYPSQSSTSPCQSRIYGVQVLTAKQATEDIQHGKVGVVVTAPNSKGGGGIEVTVGGQTPDPTSDFDVPDHGVGLATVVILLDLGPEAQTVVIEVSNGRSPMSASVTPPATGETGTGETGTGEAGETGTGETGETGTGETGTGEAGGSGEGGSGPEPASPDD